MSDTVAQVIIKALHSWGVKSIYGVSGNAILPFLDELGKQDKIRFYSTVCEQGAAFMACGEARVTGKPGVCLATEGPGALNLVNGVADAYRDGVPMLVITGQVETAKLGTNTKQYFDQQQLFAPISGSTVLLTRPESIVETFKIAMEKAIGDNTPCHISIPKDIFTAPAKNNNIPTLGVGSPPTLSGDIKIITNLLLSSRKPLIIAGRAAIPFREQVRRLAERVAAGVITAQGARGMFPGSDYFVIGGLGEAHIPPALNQADCIMLIGANPYEHSFIPSNVRVIQIDTRPQNLAHHLRPVSLTGDMALALDSLIDGLDVYEPDVDWRQKVSACHHEYIKMIEEEAELPDKPISPRKLVAFLNETLPEKAIIAIDSGEFMHWFDRGFVARKQKIIISDYWRCMGCGLPFGLGAITACPDQKVVVLTGEGGFMMTMHEVITAARYALPVTVIIFNNGRYLLEEHRMQKADMVPFGVDVQAPDFAKFATACGVEGIRVEEPAKLRGVLDRVMSQNSPVVVDVIINTEKPLYI